jgi:GH24 family phage-related lysozyme (muramidase)
MKTSKNGLDLIVKFESCRVLAYKCQAGVWTIGIGHTGLVNGKPIKKDMKIDIQTAYELLANDLAHCEREVNHYNKHYSFNQNEFDALVSFAFNVGNINQLTASGTRTKDVIARKMLEYNEVNGVTSIGLANRRKAEAQLFKGGEN